MTMMRTLEDLLYEAREEGREEGRAEGRREFVEGVAHNLGLPVTTVYAVLDGSATEEQIQEMDVRIREWKLREP